MLSNITYDNFMEEHNKLLELILDIQDDKQFKYVFSKLNDMLTFCNNEHNNLELEDEKISILGAKLFKVSFQIDENDDSASNVALDADYKKFKQMVKLQKKMEKIIEEYKDKIANLSLALFKYGDKFDI
jgi:hypothetical protein